jgi:neutral ceramidase
MRQAMQWLGIGLVLVATTVHGQQTPWRVGLAETKITPTQPLFLAGYASRNKPMEGVHDDLYAKALVLEDAAGTRGLILTTDLIGLPAEIATPVRERIARQTGIPATSILINSSHTHTGPALSLDPTPREGRGPADAERTVAYTRGLMDQLVSLAEQASRQLAPAKLSWGVGVVQFVMNRRQFTPDRGVILGVNPRGLADRSVPVLRIDGEDGRLRAVLFGCACHGTTLGPQDYLVSGDYAGHAQRLIQQQHPGATALFLLGCAGDANPYPRGSYALAEQHGRELATEVQRVLSQPLAPVSGPLRIAFGEVTLPLAAPPPKEELEKLAAGRGGTMPWVAQQMLERLSRGQTLPTSYTAPLAVWQLGSDLTLVALPGEVVVDYVRLLEEALGPNKLWIAGYTFDVFGYLPSARVLREGGYETRGLYAGGIGLFAPEAEQAVVAKVVELAKAAGRLTP